MDFNFQTEIKYIDSDTVSCSGDGLKESHPLIYLDLSSGKIATAHIAVQNLKEDMNSVGNELVLVDGSGYIFRAYMLFLQCLDPTDYQ